MKRILLICAILLAASGVVFSQTLNGLLPKTADVMGKGGASVVFSTGYDSFFGNPAGLSLNKGSLTILDLGAWAYVRPTNENLERLQRFQELMQKENKTDSENAEMGQIINSVQAENNGLGFGASTGIGWAGKKLGFGVTMVTDNYTSALNLKVQTQISGLVGLAFPIELGPLALRVGADVRAFMRTDSDGMWAIMDLVESSPEEQMVINGVGFAADAGATLKFGPLMAGVAIRDLGMDFNMGSGKFGELLGGNVPLPGTDVYRLNPKFYAGLGAGFALGKLIAPSVVVETNDLAAVIEDTDNLWTSLKVGAELKVLNLVTLRAGLNQGYPSFGAGIDFLFLEADAAFFTEEVGLYPGHRPRSGVSAQVAIRF